MPQPEQPSEVRWDPHEYPGDDLLAPFTVQVRRTTMRDRLDWAELEQRIAERQLGGGATDDELHAATLDLMARRLRDPDGTPWTSAGIDELGGHSPEAVHWLEQVLFPFVWADLETGARRRKLDARADLLARRLRAQQRIWQLDAEIVTTV